MPTWLVIAMMGIYVLITLGAAPLLAHPRLMSRHPKLILWLWVSALLTATLSLGIALTGLILRSLRHETNTIPGAVWLGPMVDTLLGWAAVAALGLVLFRLGVALAELRTRLYVARRQLAYLQRSSESTTHGQITAWRVDSATSMVGSDSQSRRIFYTTALEAQLSEDELVAALAHEQAHLRGHHALLRHIAALASATAPAFSSSREMARATRIATELAADDEAARRCGAETVARALRSSFPNEGFIDERVERLLSRER